MDKIALGRQGEIFVMQKILNLGWAFPKDYHLSLKGLDWVFEKNGKIIRIQVKCSKRKYPLFNFSSLEFDYLIFTDLKECYIFPKEIMSHGKTRLTKKFKLLSNKFDLLELEGKNLLSTLEDYGISRSLWVNTSHIFFPQELPVIAPSKEDSQEL